MKSGLEESRREREERRNTYASIFYLFSTYASGDHARGLVWPRT